MSGVSPATSTGVIDEQRGISTTSIRFGALALRPQGAGVSTYERELLAELPKRLTRENLSAVIQADAMADLPSVIQPVVRPVASGARRAWFGIAPSEKVDVFHSLDVDLPMSGPGVSVATVHDLSVFDVPWAFSRYRALGEKVMVAQSIRRADAIIAVSNFTANRVADRFGRDSIVVPLAPARWARVPSRQEEVSVRHKYGLPERYILQVGTIEPRKGVHLIADVARDLDLPFVLAGAGSDGPQAPGYADGLGFVDVADLPALYRSATVVTYASRYEGFGLPPIEAMACGAAVIASDVGALADVCDDGAVLVASEDVNEWTSAIRALWEDQERNTDIRDRAVLVAAKLTWSNTAAGTVDAYREAGIDLSSA